MIILSNNTRNVPRKEQLFFRGFLKKILKHYIILLFLSFTGYKLRPSLSTFYFQPILKHYIFFMKFHLSNVFRSRDIPAQI